MRFSPEFIDKVREENDLAEIIGQYTELKGNGHRMTGRCPFPDHLDKSPSFSVSEDSQLYFCYGCKKGGNVFTFLEQFNGMSFPESVEFLARRASIPLPEKEITKGRGPSRDQKDLFLKVNKAAAVYFHQQLKAQTSDSLARLYLQKRGLSDEIIEKFRLGLALEDWQGLVNYLRAKQVPLGLPEALGLIKPKKTPREDDSHFDLFRERLMFPIFSAAGDVVGFGGRTLNDSLPKYLNSSDSPVFNKSRVLYGIHETGKFIRALDSAIVVEGYMDAIALYSAGIKNVVAILGTAFTPEHAKLLKRYTLNVTMLLDGDEAGLNGAERSLPVLLEAGLMAKGFALPEKMDPDDFVKAHGAERLQAEVDRAPELFNLLLTRRWMQNYHGAASEKVRIVEEAAIALSRMQNRQLLDLYILEMSRQLEVDVAWVRKSFPKQTQGPIRPVGQAPAVMVPTPPPQRPLAAAPLEPVVEAEPPDENEEVRELIQVKDAPKNEAFVVSLLLHYEILFRDLLDAGPEDVIELFAHEGIRKLLAQAVRAYQAMPGSFSGLAASLSTHVDHPAVLSSALDRLDALEPSGASEVLARKLMADYMGAIRQRSLKKQGRILANQLKESPDQDKLEEFMAIQRSRMSTEKD